MLRNNSRQQGFVKYFDVQWVESESRWYAWYFVTEENFAQLDEEADNVSEA